MDASPVLKCDCDPEVGFFCAHCAMENSYIQDLQNKFIALEAQNARYREALELIVDKYFDLPEDAKMYKGLKESKESLIAREALKGE